MTNPRDDAETVARNIEQRLRWACGYEIVTDSVRGFQSSATNGLVIDAANCVATLSRQLAEARAALKAISEIEDEQYGTDWCEIEKAREIATAALSQSSAMGTTDER